jgi:hypothetical protein
VEIERHGGPADVADPETVVNIGSKNPVEMTGSNAAGNNNEGPDPSSAAPKPGSTPRTEADKAVFVKRFALKHVCALFGGPTSNYFIFLTFSYF